MPYSDKQAKFFQAVAHGMKPKGKNKLSKEEAAKMAPESEMMDKEATKKGRKRALREMV